MFLSYLQARTLCYFSNRYESTGSTGPVGSGLATFAYIHNIGTQDTDPGDDVKFNQTPIPVSLPTGLTFHSPSTIHITVAGVYDVKFYAIPQNANITLALILNDTEVDGSRYTATSSAWNLTRQALVVAAGNVPAMLTLRNIDPMQTAQFYDGRLDNTVSASILIEKQAKGLIGCPDKGGV